jgi:D-3-phosphoglycerate dehydrogenase / 2-oxoglutarate reductase
MFNILTYNNISPIGLNRFPSDQYNISDNVAEPDAIMLRSFKLHGVAIPESVKAVGRAGAGVNNIPVAEYTIPNRAGESRNLPSALPGRFRH